MVSGALTDDLLSYYSYDTDEDDDLGNNNGTNNGATLQSADCILSSCYNFDSGSSEYISYGYPDDFKFNVSAFSISFWAKINDSSTDRALVYTRETGNVHSYGFTARPSDTPNELWAGGDPSGFLRGVTQNLSDNTWYHFVGTAGGLNQNAYLYIDGVLQSHINDIANQSNNEVSGIASGEFTVGRLGNTALFYHHGLIDELGVWGRELTQADVDELYNGGSGLALENFSTCTPNWQCIGYGACNISDLAPCNSVNDTNACNESYTGNYSEFSPQACDYCDDDVVTQSITACINGLKNTTEIDNNFATCCNITSIPTTDCPFGVGNETETTSAVCSGNYDQVYDTEDITEASIDLFAVIMIVLVSVGGLIGLILVGNWLVTMWRFNIFK